MKSIPQEVVLSYMGEPLRVPQRDARGRPVKVEKGQEPPMTDAKPADIVLALCNVMEQLPAHKFTIKDSQEIWRIAPQAVKAFSAETLELEDADYDWLMGMLGNDDVGTAIFRSNIAGIIEAFKVTDKPKKEA